MFGHTNGRSIVYVDLDKGLMEEHHKLERRRKGKMWVTWFQYTTLKERDQDMAEVADIDPPFKFYVLKFMFDIISKKEDEYHLMPKRFERFDRSSDAQEELDVVREEWSKHLFEYYGSNILLN